MSERVELELLRRLEAMTVERDKEREALRAAEKRELQARAELDEERENVRTLTTHVETLREAWRSASDEVARLKGANNG